MAVQNVTQGQTPNFSVDDILGGPPNKPAGLGGGFRQALGSIAGAGLNLVAPGAGTLIGGIIGGSGLNSPGSGLGGETTQFLQLQRQMNLEMRAFETASSVLKARHDASMSAIRNIK